MADEQRCSGGSDDSRQEIGGGGDDESGGGNGGGNGGGGRDSGDSDVGNRLPAFKHLNFDNALSCQIRKRKYGSLNGGESGGGGLLPAQLGSDTFALKQILQNSSGKSTQMRMRTNSLRLVSIHLHFDSI